MTRCVEGGGGGGREEGGEGSAVDIMTLLGCTTIIVWDSIMTRCVEGGEREGERGGDADSCL